MKQFHCAENAFDLTHSVDEPGCSARTLAVPTEPTNMPISAIDLDGDYDIDFLAAE